MAGGQHETGAEGPRDSVRLREFNSEKCGCGGGSWPQEELPLLQVWAVTRQEEQEVTMTAFLGAQPHMTLSESSYRPAFLLVFCGTVQAHPSPTSHQGAGDAALEGPPGPQKSQRTGCRAAAEA